MSGEHTPSFNPWLADLVPHSATRGRWKPTVGTPDKPNYLTLSLPGEQAQVKICRVDQSGNACVVELVAAPTSRSHHYRKGQILGCRRTVDELLGVEKWEVVPEDELNAAEVAARLRRDEEAREAQTEARQTALPPPAAVEAPEAEPDLGNWSA